MQFRYMGFDQALNLRTYKFDGIAAGETARHFIVTADVGLFLKFHIGIQEGPALCLRKLAAFLPEAIDPKHQLTVADLEAYVSERRAAEAARAARRSSHPGSHHRPKPSPAGPADNNPF